MAKQQRKVKPDPKSMTVYPHTTVEEGRQFVKDMRGEEGGCFCPCCDAVRITKRYKMSNPIAQSLAHLIYLHRTDGEPVHRSKWCPLTSQGHHSAVLHHYALIVQRTGDPDKPFNRSGKWEPTALALDWVADRRLIHKHVEVDNNQYIGHSDDGITFTAAFGVPYDPEATYAREDKAAEEAVDDFDV